MIRTGVLLLNSAVADELNWVPPLLPLMLLLYDNNDTSVVAAFLTGGQSALSSGTGRGDVTRAICVEYCCCWIELLLVLLLLETTTVIGRRFL